MNKTQYRNQKQLQALRKLRVQHPSERYLRLISIADGVAHFKRDQDPKLFSEVMLDNLEADQFIKGAYGVQRSRDISQEISF